MQAGVDALHRVSAETGIKVLVRAGKKGRLLCFNNPAEWEFAEEGFEAEEARPFLEKLWRELSVK
jgi:hypothetical protein